VCAVDPTGIQALDPLCPKDGPMKGVDFQKSLA
jgi:hypothetical protein